MACVVPASANSSVSVKKTGIDQANPTRKSGIFALPLRKSIALNLKINYHINDSKDGLSGSNVARNSNY